MVLSSTSTPACINLKVRSLSSSCPKGKWAAFMDEEMEENLMKNL